MRHQNIGRRKLLGAAAGATLGSGLLLGGSMRGATAAKRPTSDESVAKDAAGASAPRQDLQVTKIGDLTGPGLTTSFRMEATDLGVPTVTPDGRMLFIFGDTFENAQVGSGWWRSPVGLYSTTTDLNAGVQWSGAVGGDVAQQLWEYDHNNPEYSTILPSDVITIGDSIYLHVMANQGLGNVVWTEIWRSDDNGATWVNTGARFAPDLHGGMFQLWTWEQGDDGFVYVFSTEFTRSKPMILHRVPVEALTDPNAYEPWGYRDGAWDWGNPPTPVLEGRFGEMCLRRFGNQWVLTWFNEADYRIDGMLIDSPVANLYEAYRRTLLWGTSWDNEDDSHIAQLYGGYIIPGSTIDELHLSVSQWNTTENWPYRVMQHRIRGFGS